MVCLAFMWLVVQGFSLVRQVVREQTDFSVFYRTAQALHGGVSAEFYALPDEPTGLRHCIPPSGTMFFFYTHWLTITAAAVIWHVFNLGLLAIGAWCLWRIFGNLDKHRRLYQRTWLWAAFLLLVLSTDSLQVGQFSVLFTTCWLAYLAVDSGLIAATMLMLPAAIKLYPALLFAIPLALRQYRQLPWLIPAGLLVVVVLPWLVYGSHLPQMCHGFFRDVILSGTRLGDMYTAVVVSNQGLDVEALRYLARLPEFQAAYPHFPHLSLHPAVVLRGVSILRLVILLVTCVAAWRLGSRVRLQPRWTALVMMALWTATLFLLLPEVKSRYAVYFFPALLPLIAIAAAQRRHLARYMAWCALLALVTVAVVQAMPHSLRPFGLSLAATATVWVILLRLAWRCGRSFTAARPTRLPETSRSETA